MKLIQLSFRLLPALSGLLLLCQLAITPAIKASDNLPLSEREREELQVFFKKWDRAIDQLNIEGLGALYVAEDRSFAHALLQRSRIDAYQQSFISDALKTSPATYEVTLTRVFVDLLEGREFLTFQLVRLDNGQLRIRLSMQQREVLRKRDAQSKLEPVLSLPGPIVLEQIAAQEIATERPPLVVNVPAQTPSLTKAKIVREPESKSKAKNNPIQRDEVLRDLSQPPESFEPSDLDARLAGLLEDWNVALSSVDLDALVAFYVAEDSEKVRRQFSGRGKSIDSSVQLIDWKMLSPRVYQVRFSRSWGGKSPGSATRSMIVVEREMALLIRATP